MVAGYKRSIVLFFADVLALLLSSAIAILLRMTADHNSIILEVTYLFPFLVFILISIFFLFFAMNWEGVYSDRSNLLENQYSRKLMRGLVIALLSIFLLSYLPTFASTNKSLIISMIVVNLILTPFLRSMIAALSLPNYSRRGSKRKLMILGNSTAGQDLLRWVIQDRQQRYDLLGFLENDSSRLGQYLTTDSREIRGSAKIIGNYASFDEIISKNKPDEIWLNDPRIRSEVLDGVFQTCKSNEIDVSFLPSFGDYPPRAFEIEMLDSIPALRIKQVKTMGFYDFLKRLFDIMASSLLILISSPAILTIAIFIKREVDGSAIFTQKRVGKDGKLFDLYKLRTMYINSDKYSVSPKSPKDPRITPLGRILRKTSLDELPQLINVLKGEMSLVGPRPEMPFIVEQYSDIHRLRLAVKPGITGLWQLSEDRSLPIHQNLDYDLFYIENRSHFLDLTLLWRTLFFAMRGI